MSTGRSKIFTDVRWRQRSDVKTWHDGNRFVQTAARVLERNVASMTSACTKRPQIVVLIYHLLVLGNPARSGRRFIHWWPTQFSMTKTHTASTPRPPTYSTVDIIVHTHQSTYSAERVGHDDTWCSAVAGRKGSAIRCTCRLTNSKCYCIISIWYSWTAALHDGGGTFLTLNPMLCERPVKTIQHV